MINLDGKQLYIVGGTKSKTHLAYVEMVGQWDEGAFLLCLPNIPIQACWDCKGEDCHDASRKTLADWDRHYNEVTCKTCLKRARGWEANP